MDLEALEEQWKDGDDEDLLKSDKQLEFEKLERQRKEAEAARPKIDSRWAGNGVGVVGALHPPPSRHSLNSCLWVVSNCRLNSSNYVNETKVARWA